MKLHLACGDVFLTEYFNCDIEGEVVPTRIIGEQSDSFPYRSLENYYSNRLVGHKHQTYVDRKFDLRCYQCEQTEQMLDVIAVRLGQAVQPEILGKPVIHQVAHSLVASHPITG